MLSGIDPALAGSLRFRTIRGTTPAGWDELVRADATASYFMTRNWWNACLTLVPRSHQLAVTAWLEGRLVAGIAAVEQELGPWRRVFALPMGTHGGVLLHPKVLRDAPRPEPAGDLPWWPDRDPRWFFESSLAAELALRLFELPRLLECHFFDAAGRAGERLAFLPGVQCSFPVQRLLATDRSTAELWGGLSSRCRNKVRRAQRAGVRVNRASAPSAGMATVVHLREEMQRRRGLDLGVSDALLKNLAESFGDSPDAFRVDIWHATLPHEPHPVAALVNLAAPHRIQNHAALASDRGRAVAAHNALHWAAIQDAAQRGCRIYDFGLSEGLPGVDAFKASFGAAPVRMRAWQRIHPSMRAVKAARRRWGGGLALTV